MELENSSMVRNAWEELMLIGKERKRFKEIRYRTEQALELCRQRGVQLENVRMTLQLPIGIKKYN